ncbi:lytic transglycosylase domain-containing protein [Candidatus Kaiserbacteria bacterium]|nr:lytic transglycosylase domain-containing protein [Candidatus Kaiserbacteria bacterium]
MSFEGIRPTPKRKDHAPDSPPEERGSDVSRREVLRFGLRAAIAAALAGGTALEVSRRLAENPDDIENLSEKLSPAAESFKTLYEHAKIDEVLFIDADSRAVGGPMKIEPVDGVSPGKVDYNGVIFPKNISKKWYDAAEAKLHREHPDAAPGALACRSTIGVLNAHIFTKLPLKDRPIARKSLTMIDVVRDYAEKPTPAHENSKLLDYVRTNALNANEKAVQNLPPTVVATLRELVPGLAAQESHFDTTAKSVDPATGKPLAVGLFQFLPETFATYFPDKKDQADSVELQTEALGMHFLSIYRQLQKGAKDSLQKILAQCFDGNTEVFERQFLVPVMVNAYNSGQGTLTKIINGYVAQYDGSFPAHGRDVYDHMRTDAYADAKNGHTLYPNVKTYGTDSAEYTPRVYALAELLKKPKRT